MANKLASQKVVRKMFTEWIIGTFQETQELNWIDAYTLAAQKAQSELNFSLDCTINPELHMYPLLEWVLAETQPADLQSLRKDY